MSTTTEMLTLGTDIASALISLGVLLVAALGLKQISEVKLARINQAERDSYEYSDKIVDYFLEKIVPKLEVLNSMRNEFSIRQPTLKEFEHPKQIFEDRYTEREFHEFKQLFEKTKLDNGEAKYINTSIELCNLVEKICFMISTNLSHKDFVYDCIGNAVLALICKNKDTLRFIKSSSTKRAGAGKFIFTQKVYAEWYQKNSSEKNHAEISSLEQEILKLKQEIQHKSSSPMTEVTTIKDVSVKPVGTY